MCHSVWLWLQICGCFKGCDFIWLKSLLIFSDWLYFPGPFLLSSVNFKGPFVSWFIIFHAKFCIYYAIVCIVSEYIFRWLKQKIWIVGPLSITIGHIGLTGRCSGLAKVCSVYYKGPFGFLFSTFFHNFKAYL